MKIDRIQTFLVPPSRSPDGWTGVKAFLFVKITTDTGLSGWGEAYLLPGRERVIKQVIVSLAPLLLGQDPSEIRKFRSRAVVEFADKRTGIDFYCGLSALEIALWDILGKSLNAPVYKLLGGRLRDAIPLYVSAWSDRRPSIDLLVARAQKMRADGFRAIKIYPMEFSSLAEAETCVRRVREAIGRDTDLMIDLNGLEDPYLAIKAARAFERYEPFWFEEPVSSEDLSALRHVRSASRLRIVSGERHGGICRFREILEREAADVLNPDICGCGGILEFLAISALAQAFSAQMTPHNYNSMTVGMAAMLHVSAVIPNLLVAEYVPAFQAMSDQLAKCDFRIADGAAGLPQAPGLGVAMHEQALAKLASGETVA
jgi:galactonate dehydratase